MLSAAVAEWLQAQELGPVFVEHLPEVPDDCVAVYSRGGLTPETHVGLDRCGVQVLVRGAGGDPRPSYRLAMAVYNALHNLAPGAAIGTDPDNREMVQLVSANQSGPVSIGRDTKGRYEWSLNFTVRVWNPGRRT